MLLYIFDRLIGLHLLQSFLLSLWVPAGAEPGVGVGLAKALASTHVHMIVLLLGCVILS
jgi:hypothetical protein